jgi:hypothetical protein
MLDAAREEGWELNCFGREEALNPNSKSPLHLNRKYQLDGRTLTIRLRLYKVWCKRYVFDGRVQFRSKLWFTVFEADLSVWLSSRTKWGIEYLDKFLETNRLPDSPSWLWPSIPAEQPELLALHLKERVEEKLARTIKHMQKPYRAVRAWMQEEGERSEWQFTDFRPVTALQPSLKSPARLERKYSAGRLRIQIRLYKTWSKHYVFDGRVQFRSERWFTAFSVDLTENRSVGWEFFQYLGGFLSTDKVPVFGSSSGEPWPLRGHIEQPELLALRFVESVEETITQQ